MKRGESGLSMLIAIDKPLGCTSHDVVSQVRRIFGEKRVGHSGTLDPLATGVLPIAVGPATRLCNFLTSDRKEYVAVIEFGRSTTTDDSQGETVATSPVPDGIFDPFFATSFLNGLKGRSKQMPPVYSAIKVNGKKACDEARRGNVIELEARDIEVYRAELLGIDGADGFGAASWKVRFDVSKGTYIRSIARDIGIALGCPAHIAGLRRVNAGPISLDDCVSLETIAEVKERACLDPVRVLGHSFLYAEDALGKQVANGSRIHEDDIELFAYKERQREMCACTSGIQKVCDTPEDGELISVISGNALKAIYRYDARNAQAVPECIFQIPVKRHHDI